MGDAREIQLQIRGAQEQPSLHKDATASNQPLRPSSMSKSWRWWLMIALNILFVLAGQTAGILLGRLYYNEGGNSKWMATLVQCAGFPILFLPLLLFPSPSFITSFAHPPITKIAFIYISLGLIIAGDNLIYSCGLLYLPISTYSLVCATQLAFNAVFTYFLNSQKFTPFIFNSVILLTFSSALLGIQSDSEDSTDVPKGKYSLRFVLTLGASAIFSLISSLIQLTLQKVPKIETFSIVLQMQLCISFIASIVCVVGLFASGEWKVLEGEMDGFGKGRVSYVMTSVCTAVAWQVASVGMVGLILVVSSLFSNVIGTLALPVVPIFAVIFFHDKMDGVKVMATLIAVWGFISYIYQDYLDDSKAKRAIGSDSKDGSGVSIPP
ncbi:probable purine permease 11 [Elaeis guineensis]|uniref:Probable purine permease n=1 Tax=Elaeis guineensis var. tenera TaxID=51953 RepID=A0A6I9SDG5_ELAGV|nr:probable purine permease 11 [Elaeis guineensis]